MLTNDIQFSWCQVLVNACKRTDTPHSISLQALAPSQLSEQLATPETVQAKQAAVMSACHCCLLHAPAMAMPRKK